MSSISDPRLERLLAAALEVPPEARVAFLDEACGDDLDLRRELEELSALSDRADGFFDGLASDIVEGASLEIETAVRPRIEVGPYRTRSAIGRGGMGVVYRASRADGAFEQDVALKLLHLDMLTPDLYARFVAERQLLARLQHPNVARLLDGGVTAEGRPYLVMELIDGRSITEHCRRKRLALEEVLGLFLQVAEAVSYLHRNLVVHRDLKPSNLLVDREGMVKLLDFGVAKILADEGAALTKTGGRLLTPRYAAPEQIAGGDITTATDVYGLGAVLYELLSGRAPRAPRDATLGAAPSNEAPQPPSAALAREDETTADAGRAWSRVPRDLETICLKALRAEPARRYASAGEMARDVQRFLEGQPVEARPSTLAYRLSKFVRRHRLGATLAAVAVVLVAAAVVRERRLREAAEMARQEAVSVSSFLDELLVSATPERAQGREMTVAEVLERAARRLEEDPSLVDQPSVEASARLTIGKAYVSLGQYATARTHLERALELRGEGTESEEVIESLVDLYTREDLHERAERLATRLWEARKAGLGEEHPDTLAASSLLAGVYWSWGRVDETEALDRRNLQIRRRRLGNDHPETLTAINSLGSTLFSQGRYFEAKELYEEALAGQRRVHGDRHPETLKATSNLASTLSAMGRVREAVPVLRQAVEGRSEVLGDQHPRTATSLHSLGAALIKLARYNEAERVLERALLARSKLDARAPYLGSLALLAQVRAERGNREEAIDLYRQALAEQALVLGSDDAETLATQARLAELLAATGDTDAESLLASTLERQIAVLGSEHRDCQRTFLGLAGIHHEQGRYEESLELSQQVAARLHETLGVEHLSTLDASFQAARALAALDRHQEARRLATRVYTARSKLLGADHPATLEARMLAGPDSTGGP